MRTYVTNPTKVAAGNRDGPFTPRPPARRTPGPAVAGQAHARSTGQGPAAGGGTTDRTELVVTGRKP